MLRLFLPVAPNPSISMKCSMTSAWASPQLRPRSQSRSASSTPTTATMSRTSTSPTRPVSPTVILPLMKNFSVCSVALPASTSRPLPALNARLPKRSTSSTRRALLTATLSQAPGLRLIWIFISPPTLAASCGPRLTPSPSPMPRRRHRFAHCLFRSMWSTRPSFLTQRPLPPMLSRVCSV